MHGIVKTVHILDSTASAPCPADHEGVPCWLLIPAAAQSAAPGAPPCSSVLLKALLQASNQQGTAHRAAVSQDAAESECALRRLLLHAAVQRRPVHRPTPRGLHLHCMRLSFAVQYSCSLCMVVTSESASPTPRRGTAPASPPARGPWSAACHNVMREALPGSSTTHFTCARIAAAAQSRVQQSMLCTVVEASRLCLVNISSHGTQAACSMAAQRAAVVAWLQVHADDCRHANDDPPRHRCRPTQQRRPVL